VNSDRQKTVQSLIELSRPLDFVAEEIHKFKWDYDGETVELRPNHLLAILNAFLEGHMSADEVEKWANLVEGREDISFEPASRDWIEQAIYELANPALTTPLTRDRARELVKSCPTKKGGAN
jgi:hypothetical protein